MKDFFKFYFGMKYRTRGFPTTYPKLPAIISGVLLVLSVAFDYMSHHLDQIPISESVIRTAQGVCTILLVISAPVYLWKFYKLNKKAMLEEEKRKDFEREHR